MTWHHNLVRLGFWILSYGCATGRSTISIWLTVKINETRIMAAPRHCCFIWFNRNIPSGKDKLVDCVRHKNSPTYCIYLVSWTLLDGIGESYGGGGESWTPVRKSLPRSHYTFIFRFNLALKTPWSRLLLGEPEVSSRRVFYSDTFTRHPAFYRPSSKQESLVRRVA